MLKLACCVDSCSYYGLLAQRFCMLHQKWQALFEDCFQRQYALIHRLETNKLRNVAKFFAHLLHTDAISWVVLSTIHLTEDDTTSSSRIFIKILVQVWVEPCLSDRLAIVCCRRIERHDCRQPVSFAAAPAAMLVLLGEPAADRASHFINVN